MRKRSSVRKISGIKPIEGADLIELVQSIQGGKYKVNNLSYL